MYRSEHNDVPQLESFWSAYGTRITLAVLVALSLGAYVWAFVSGHNMKEIVACNRFELMLDGCTPEEVQEKMGREPDLISGSGSGYCWSYDTADMPVRIQDTYMTRMISRIHIFFTAPDGTCTRLEYDHEQSGEEL